MSPICDESNAGEGTSRSDCRFGRPPLSLFSLFLSFFFPTNSLLSFLPFKRETQQNRHQRDKQTPFQISGSITSSPHFFDSITTTKQPNPTHPSMNHLDSPEYSTASNSSSQSLSPPPSFTSSNQARREESTSNLSTITIPPEMDHHLNGTSQQREEMDELDDSLDSSLDSNMTEVVGSGLEVESGGEGGGQGSNPVAANSPSTSVRRTQRSRQPPARTTSTTSNVISRSSSNSGTSTNGKDTSTNKQSASTSTSTRPPPRSSKKDYSSSNTNQVKIVRAADDPRGPTRRGQPRKLFRYLLDYEALGVGTPEEKEAAQQAQAAIIAAQQEESNAKAKRKKKDAEGEFRFTKKGGVDTVGF